MGLGVGVAKSGGVTKVVAGVLKNIPCWASPSSLILGLSDSWSFSGLWNGFRVGVPKLSTLKLSLRPSSRPLPLTAWTFCCPSRTLGLVGRLEVLGL